VSDRYLWDGSGPPDPGVRRLERLLGRYRFAGGGAANLGLPARRRRARSSPAFWFAAAAALALACYAGLRFLARDAGGTQSAYAVEGLAGVVRAAAGDAIETGDAQATLRVASLGEVLVEPGSRLEVEDCGEEAHRLFLRRGSVRASITAAPRQFQIGTPAGLTVDLGCRYELTVDPAGRSRLSVLHGRVAFEGAGRKVLVPSGAWCEATREEGPLTPFAGGTPDALVEAVRAVERDPSPEAGAVEVALEASGLTLWHLYRNGASPGLRERALERVLALYPLPRGVSEARVRAGESGAIEAWEEAVARRWPW
jgi:hypothetical protein